MEFEITSWPISQLVELAKTEAINLRPPYQRNYIWTPIAKRRLIQTIHDGFPLPAFFLHETTPGKKYDMVDGQQRTRTIFGYLDGLFKDERKKFYDPELDSEIPEYRIPVVIIRNVPEDDGVSIRTFYYRVNKFGTKLNKPEINKAQYPNSALRDLIEEIAGSENWDNLNLFTEVAENRMADFDFVAELLTLLKFGITDQKRQVDKFYGDATFYKGDAEDLRLTFDTVLAKISTLNKEIPISNTRYRQRNDFFTLFDFIHQSTQLTSAQLGTTWNILTRVGPSISPSNEKCSPLQDYAFDCVSQSNSKPSRERRLSFFNALLLNTEPAPMADKSDADKNPILADILRYFKLTNAELVSSGAYFVPEPQRLITPKH